jgi:hypothetical protein
MARTHVFTRFGKTVEDAVAGLRGEYHVVRVRKLNSSRAGLNAYQVVVRER